MYQDKKLVVFFSMHRSGSSFSARLFQRLGLSLGPFKLVPGNRANPYGHFEASPFVAVNSRCNAPRSDLQTRLRLTSMFSGASASAMVNGPPAKSIPRNSGNLEEN